MSTNAQDVQITFDNFQEISVQNIKCNLIVDNIDFDVELNNYLRNLSVRNFSDNTLKVYRSIISNFYKELINHNVKDNQKDFVNFFENYINNLDSSISYKYSVITTIRGFVNRIGIPYLDDFGNVKKPKSVPHPLTEEEIYLLLDTIQYDDRIDSVSVVETRMRNKLIIQFLYSTGLRVSELCNIKISDLDLLNCRLNIIGKGNKERVVVFDKVVCNEVKKYLDKRITMSKYLFPNTRSKIDKPLTPRAVQKMIKSCADKAGFTKKVTPHSLRHSFATNLLRKGMNMRYIQELMGHDSIATTQLYIHAELSDVQYEYDKLK